MAVQVGDPELKYWYFVLAGGGVESGDTSMDMPTGARVVDTEQEMSMAVDIALDRQLEEAEAEQQAILDVVAAELGEEDEEELLITHSDFKGMGNATWKAFADKGIKSVQQLVELGAEGIFDLKIARVTDALAKQWYERAVNLIGSL